MSAPLASAASASAASVQADPVLVAAGDVACAPSDPLFSGSNPSACQMRATANQVVRLAPNYLLPLGDLQYAASSASQGTQPTASDYQNSYNTTWGQIGSSVPGLVVRPVPGNHEYGDTNGGSPPLASGSTYYDNFGSHGLNQLPAGVTSASNDYYSYDIPVNGGRWHVIALDSECNTAVGGCQAGSPQESWLHNDLAANPNTCTIAYWHEPRWTSGGTAGVAQYGAFWNDLVAARATMVLNGHEHGYQHLAPLDANGSAKTGGVTQFVVGTGGKDHEAADAPGPAVIAQDSTDFGVLKLTLHASSASYAFQTTGGATPDAGTVNCPAASPPPSSGAPTVSGVAPISGPSPGGTRISVSGTNFTAATTVSVGGNPATNILVNSPTSLTATVPTMTASPGASTVDVTATTSSGTSAPSPADQFTYTFATNGYSANIRASTTNPAVGGAVTLTATSNKDMGPTPYGLSIVDATTNTQIAHIGGGTTATVSVSQSAAGTHRYIARIDNPNGANTQAVSTPAAITWGSTSPPPPAARPTVAGVSPSSGSTAGGTPVTITGTNFAAGATVSFGAAAATKVIVNSSSTSVTATSPAGSATVDVTVTTAGGTSAASAADQFTYTAPPAPPSSGAPTVSGVAPISGPSPGGTRISVSGTNFTAATTVSVGGNPATNILVNSPTSLTATVPTMTASPGASTVDVTATTSSGTSAPSPADQFTYTFATNGYSANIRASTTNPAVGGAVTLTATSNKDMGPTPYGLSIVDATTNTQIAHIGGGTTATVSVSQSAAGTHRYIARIDNPNGANTQAVSTPAAITWR